MSETRTVETICDGCGKSLHEPTSYESEYYLVLDNKAKAPAAGFVFGMGLPRRVPQARHFCNLRCLGDWVARRDGGAR